MKKVLGFSLMIFLVSLTSCTKEESISWKTSYDFTIENLMGEEIDRIQSTETPAIATNGYIVSEENKTISGTQVAGSKKRFNATWGSGLEVHLKYVFSGDMYSDKYSSSMFEALWAEGTVHSLGVDGPDFLKNSILYIAIESEGKVNEYVTEVNSSGDESSIEILSKKYIGTSESNRDVYEIIVKFKSRMVNTEDPFDIIFIRDGVATLKVPNFNEFPTR